jgi:Protein of unknown function (DUF559)
VVFKANPGGKDHVKARDRVMALFESRGFSLEKEVEFKDCETEVGLRDYTADIVATMKVIIEIDGKTHWSKAARHKDQVRDIYFKTQHIPTLRLQQSEVIGRNQAPDDLLMAEFFYQIWGSKIA